MTVIIEYVILDNFIFNYLLLYLAALTVKKKPRHRRIALSAALGAGAAIMFSLLSWGGVLPLLIKVALAPIMCLIADGYINIKEFIRHNLFFLAYTFVLGGTILALFYSTGTAFSALGTVAYNSEVPLFVYCGAALFVFIVGRAVAGYIKFQKTSGVTQIEITTDKTYAVKAIVDTGNSLRYNGIPVCFAVGRRMKKVLLPYFAQCVLDESVRRIEVQTVTGRGEKNAVPARVCIDGNSCEILLCTAQAESAYYEVLLNAEITSGR